MISLYLAHPFFSRNEIRQWELKTEQELGVDLRNPFYDDVERQDVAKIDAGKLTPYSRTLDANRIVLGDLSMIDACNGILAVIDGNISCGTFMEIFYAKEQHLPVLTICTTDLKNHPWIRYCSAEIFTSFKAFEMFWKKAKKLREGNLQGIRLGLMGKKRSGKDTAGAYLVDTHNFKRFSFAEELKYLSRRLFGFTRQEVEDKPAHIRDVLQRFGTEGIRAIWPDTWAQLLKTRIDRYYKLLPEQYANIVVTDVRFQNEADILRENGFKIVKIKRQAQDDDRHLSETAQDAIVADFEVENIGGIEDYYEQLEVLLANIKKEDLNVSA